MKFLYSFNESSSEDINEYLNDIFISLIDIGYRIDISSEKSGDSKSFLINIDKYENKFNLFDIRDELLRCVYFLEEEGIILNNILLVTEDRPYVEIHRGSEVKEILNRLDNNIKWSNKFRIKKIKLNFLSKNFSIPKSFTLK